MPRKRIFFGPSRREVRSRYMMITSAMAGAALMLFPATADSMQLSATSLIDGETTPLSAIATGDQAVLSAATGEADFAGYTLEMVGFSGSLGQSSEAAYVLVADGSARAGNETAKAGDILVLLPDGEGVIRQIFDAGRYASSWDAAAANAHPDVYDRLGRLARRQKIKVFFGRLGPTAFNIAAPGSASKEAARRSIVGAEPIRQIRFSARDGAGTEQRIVSMFVEALAEGDAQTVASLLDPAPYGIQDLRHGGSDARLVMAQRLIDGQAWQGLAASSAQEVADGVWLIPGAGGNAEIALRRTTDFAFIQSIDFQAGE